MSFECTHCQRAFYFDQSLFERAWNYLQCFSCEGLMFVSRDLGNRIALKNKPPVGFPVFDTLPEEIRIQKNLEKVLATPRPAVAGPVAAQAVPIGSSPTKTNLASVGAPSFGTSSVGAPQNGKPQNGKLNDETAGSLIENITPTEAEPSISTLPILAHHQEAHQPRNLTSNGLVFIGDVLRGTALRGAALRFFLGLVLGASVGTVIYFIFQGKAAWDALQLVSQ